MIPLTKGKRLVSATFFLGLANFGVRGKAPGALDTLALQSININKPLIPLDLNKINRTKHHYYVAYNGSPGYFGFFGASKYQ